MKTWNPRAFRQFVLATGAIAISSSLLQSAVVPVITQPAAGATFLQGPVDVQISVQGIANVQSVRLRSNGNPIGYATPTSLFGEWKFPDGSHLSVMNGINPGETMLDYNPPEGESMFMMHGTFGTTTHFTGEFTTWVQPNPDPITGPATVDFAIDPAGLLDVSIAGNSPLGTRALADGLSQNAGYHFMWDQAPLGSHALTVAVVYLPEGSSTPVTVVSEPVSITVIAPPAPEIAVFHPKATALENGSASMDCGSSLIGQDGEARTIYIRNTGIAFLTGITVSKSGKQAGEFTITGPVPQALAPGARTSFQVVLKPAKEGPRAAVLRIASNDADENPFKIEVTGSGLLPTPEIAIEQPAGSGLIDNESKRKFGTVKVGEKSALKTFTIRNKGMGRLKNLEVTKDGVNAADFVLTQPAATGLAAGESTQFKVAFKPKAKGTRSAKIHVRSNDANENPFDIGLSGLGAAP